MLLWCHGWGYKQLQQGITHPYYMYTKCFSTLICCGLKYGYTLTLLYRCRRGWIIWKVGVWVRANGIVVSWLRLQTASDCIPHPYHMYTKCFCTLICCGWTYRCTLTLLYPCKWGWIFAKLVFGRGRILLWCHCWGYKQIQKASHIHIIFIQSVLAPWYAVDWNMDTPLHCYTSAGGGEF